jgi:hypothetical protein
VQALVLTPTRELAVQVAEAFHTYAKHMGSVRVLPVYGGQPIGQQLRRLQAGVQVVVGTPGRVMDHLRRESLDLVGLKFVVLDEADEMLRVGFIEDVEWILGAHAAGAADGALLGDHAARGAPHRRAPPEGAGRVAWQRLFSSAKALRVPFAKRRSRTAKIQTLPVLAHRSLIIF